MSVYQVPEHKDIFHQELKSIRIENLKCLKNVEIDFPSEHPMVAIMAPNGCGKSSILHALYCSYNIPNTSADINYFSRFFRPTNLNQWNNSKFTIKYSFQYLDKTSREKKCSGDKEKEYVKTSQRWCRYEERPIRYVFFIGIESCVPSIERYSSQRGSTFSKQNLNTEHDIKVKESASRVMNRNYTDYCRQETKSKKLIGVTYSNIEYSAFSMGAGEQRIFYILDKVLNAPKNSLILIDEIDLLLHEGALSRLLDELNRICNDNNLQLIFTTHSRSVLNKDYIAFRNLHQTSDRTICLDKCYPEFLSRLTGQPERQYEIFVEDEVAEAIVLELCLDNCIKSEVNIIKYGTAKIGVKSACGMVTTDPENVDKVLFVTDGDKEMFADGWYSERINEFFKGNDPALIPKREKALKSIKRFIMGDDKVSPEEYYRKCILELDPESLLAEEKEIYDALNDIVVPVDKHDYFKKVIDNVNLAPNIGINMIVRLLKKTKQWKQIVEQVQAWIDFIKPNILIPKPV